MFLFIVTVGYFAAFFLFFSRFLEGARRKLTVDSAVAGLKTPATMISRRFMSDSLGGSIRKRLNEAGQPRGMDADGFLAVKVLGLAAGFGLAIPLAIVGSGSFGARLAMGILLSAGGFFAPDVWLSRTIAARRTRIRQDLPDFLDLLTVSVEAGLGFDSALSRVAGNSRGALAEEFGRVLKEVQLGSSRKKAFKSLMKRVEVDDMRSFGLAVLQADTFGVSVGKALREQAKEMRSRRATRAEETAMKAPVKIVFPLVLCIMPALFIVILGPAGIQMYNSLFLTVR